jgi:molybdenum cofactor cytidylyltransferase
MDRLKKPRISLPTDDLDDEELLPEEASTPEKGVSVILLAAGSSSRMGQSKQLLDIQGTPLLLHSTKVALASGASHVIVVLGANEQPHREVIKDLPVSIILNHFWKGGMGSSIKTGMNALMKEYPETNAVILMVCDQPAVTADHLRSLIQNYSSTKSPIVATGYAGTIGVPALFGRPFYSNILMLRDDQGAKKIMQQFPSKVKSIDFPNAVHDLDTREDYQNFMDK